MAFREESPVIRLSGLATDKRVARLMPETISRRFSIVPLWVEPDRMMVACTDPLDDELIREAETACRRSLGVFKAGYTEIRDALERCYGRGSHQSARLDLGGILYQSGLISAEALFKARAEQKNPVDPWVEFASLRES